MIGNIRWPLICLSTLLIVSLPTTGGTPVPEARGPLPVTSTSYPFGAADHEGAPEDLSRVGYVEEEYVLSGKANVYDWPAPGPAVVQTAGAPYTTRVLIRRPASRARFSGVVVVEMANPSNLFDLNLGWAMTHKQFVSDGDAWVMITAKPISVLTLKKFDPIRYATLSWDNPLSADDRQNCSAVASDSFRTTENGLVWDIFSQTGAWLRSSDSSNPLTYGVRDRRELPVRHLYAWGYSQTGAFLYTYVNAIHPLDSKLNGRPIFDAYLIAVASGPVPINQCAKPLPEGDPRRMIRNAGVPVIRVMSQSDYLLGIAGRRPDSDTPPDLYRNYEIAGAAHATPDELDFSAAPEDIRKGGRAVPAMVCNEGPRSRFPSSVAFDAIFHNLDLWVRSETPPPHAEPIAVDTNREPTLDQHGNVTGGIRSPYLDVPTSTWFGNSSGVSFCFIAGHEIPFGPQQIRKLYSNHETYVRLVKADVEKLVNERWITSADGDALISEAERSRIP